MRSYIEYGEWAKKKRDKYEYSLREIVSMTIMPCVCVYETAAVPNLNRFEFSSEHTSRLGIDGFNFFPQTYPILDEINIDIDSVSMKSISRSPDYASLHKKIYLYFVSNNTEVVGVIAFDYDFVPEGGWSNSIQRFEQQFLRAGGDMVVGHLPRSEQSKVLEAFREWKDTVE